MKTPLKTLITLLGATLGTCLTASAQLMQVNSGNPILNVNPVPSSTQGPSNDGGTTGSNGYEFFKTTATDGHFTDTGDIISPTSYVSSITPLTGESASGSNSQLVIAGTDYFTGELSNTIFGNQTTNSADLAKVVLGGSGATPTFDIGFLADNSAFSGTSLYTLSLYSGVTNTQIGTTLAVNSTTTGSTNADDFYYAQVTDPTGGANGDYLVISAGSSLYGNAINDAVALGGVTFDTVTAPEPTTYALLGLGMAFLFMTVRNRRSLRA
jgi:hypothetical protein